MKRKFGHMTDDRQTYPSTEEFFICRNAASQAVKLLEASYLHALGLEVLFADAGYSELSMVFDRRHNRGEVMNGGVLASLIAAASAAAAISHFHPTYYVSSRNLRIRFYETVRSGKVVAKGTVRSADSGLAFCDVQVVDHAGTLICEGSSELVPWAHPAGPDV